MKSLRRLAAIAAAFGFFALAPAAHAEFLEAGHAPGLCLDFSSGQGAIYRCNGSDAQDIGLPQRGSGSLNVSGSCVVAGGQGQPLYLARCRNRDEQRWYYDSSGALVNKNGLCADVEGGRRREGTRVIAYACNNHSNQLWRITDGYDGGYPPDGGYPGGGSGYPGGGGDYDTALLSPMHAPGMCLDVDAGSNLMIIFNCHGRSNQRFSFTTYGETEIQVGRNCVTAPSSAGRQLYVARCTGAYSQRWNFQSDGTVRSASGYCMDVDGASRQPSAQVQIFRCSGKTNQRWLQISR
jgi:hypothetical protein